MIFPSRARPAYAFTAGAAALASFLLSCMSADRVTDAAGTDSDSAGALQVTVKDRSGRPDIGAWVAVDGATPHAGVTDSFGQAVFFGMQPGQYALSAMDDFGYGEVRTQIIQGDVARSEIRLLNVSPPGPAFSTTAPEVFETAPGDTVRFDIKLEDAGLASGAAWEVESDRDGKLDSGSFPASGTVN